MRLAIGFFVLAGAMTAQATPANASIGTCYGYYSAVERWDAYCYGSYPSSYRAIADCYKITTGAKATRYGSWKTAGGSGTSSVTCLTGEEIANGRWQTAP